MLKDLVEGVQHSNYKATDIALYFLKNFDCSSITYFKLNKLVYLAFGWGIPFLDHYLFNDEIVAKEKGPVVKSI